MAAPTQRLLAGQRRLSAVATMTGIGVTLADASGLVVSADARSAELAGCPARALHGRGWLARVPDEERAAVAAAWSEAVVGGRAFGQDHRFRRDDGREVWVQSRAEPELDEQGAVAGWVMTFVDITARREAAAALQARDQFLAAMSHELRTPLNAVLGVTELLTEGIHGPLLEAQRRALGLIESSGRHLLSLISDVLDLSRAQAGTFELERSEVDISKVVAEALRMVGGAASKKGITLAVARDPLLRFVSADERRLRQMLVNLLANAVKFTPDGGRVGLEVEADEGHVRFVVWDTGIGIPEADQARLFRPFTQLDAGLARRFEGTGLGLYLVSRMAELHGGRVSVESRGVAGEGSRFTLSLPWGVDLDGVGGVLASAGLATPYPRDRDLLPLAPTLAMQLARLVEVERAARAVVQPRWQGATERLAELRPAVALLVVDGRRELAGARTSIPELLAGLRAASPGTTLLAVAPDEAELGPVAESVLRWPADAPALRAALGGVAPGASVLVVGALDRPRRALVAAAPGRRAELANDLVARGWLVTEVGVAELRAAGGGADLIVVDEELQGGLEAAQAARAGAGRRPALVVLSPHAVEGPGRDHVALRADAVVTATAGRRTRAMVIDRLGERGEPPAAASRAGRSSGAGLASRPGGAP